MALTLSTHGTLAIAAARFWRSDCTQWHAWSAVSKQIKMRNELWGPWQPQKLSAEELHPRQVPSIDYTSAHVERHALADLALMIPMAQAQAGGSTRMSDVHIITINISRRAADRAANEGAAQPDFNSAAPPASLAAGGHSGPCRTSRKPRHVSSRFGCRRDAAICTAGALRAALRLGDFEWPMVEKNI